VKIDLLIKIGGSCLSNKMLLYKALNTKNSESIKAALEINSENVELIASELGTLYSSGKKMIVLTGVGSPGHYTVLKHALHKGDNGTDEQHLGLLEAQIAVNRLRQLILEVFLKYKIPSVQFYASSMYQSENRRIITSYTENMEKFLGRGLVPVISGDMVPDGTMGYSVLSGDQILADLAVKFKPSQIVYGSDVDGIYDSDPNVNPTAQLIPEISQGEIGNIIEQLTGEDASGQMKGKLLEIKGLLENGFEEVFVLNLTKKGNLFEAMNGKRGSFTRFY
jgi:isopentenyl phosphate kinase